MTDTVSAKLIENLKGKRAIVTGASSGIGKEVALMLLRAGVQVSLVSRHPDQILGELPKGSNAKGYAIDLADISAVLPKMQAIAADMGGVDILINNAGAAYIGELIDMPLTEWQRLFDLNVTSVFQCLQAILPTMRSQKSGTIINVASIAGKQAFPSWGAYSATKFALLGMNQAIAAEEQPHGIRIVAICPGSVDTPLWDSLGDKVSSNFNRAAMLRPITVANSIMSLINLPTDAVINDLVLMPNAGVF